MKTAQQIVEIYAEPSTLETDARGGDLYSGALEAVQGAIDADRAQHADIVIRTDAWNNAYLTEGERVLHQITDGDTLQDLIEAAADPSVRATASSFADVGLTGGA